MNANKNRSSATAERTRDAFQLKYPPKTWGTFGSEYFAKLYMEKLEWWG